MSSSTLRSLGFYVMIIVITEIFWLVAFATVGLIIGVNTIPFFAVFFLVTCGTYVLYMLKIPKSRDSLLSKIIGELIDLVTLYTLLFFPTLLAFILGFDEETSD